MLCITLLHRTIGRIQAIEQGKHLLLAAPSLTLGGLRLYASGRRSAAQAKHQDNRRVSEAYYSSLTRERPLSAQHDPVPCETLNGKLLHQSDNDPRYFHGELCKDISHERTIPTQDEFR